MSREETQDVFDVPDPESRRQAVASLQESAHEQAGELLMLALGDTDWRVRKQAVQVAKELTRRFGLLPDLITAITQGDNVGLRNASLEVLGELGEDVADDLVAALRDVPVQGLKFVVEALGASRSRRGVRPLGELAGHQDPNVVAAAIDALSMIGGPQAEALLIEKLKSAEPFHRVAALTALERLGAQVPWNALQPLLGDRMVRRVAVKMLGRCGTREAIAPLVAAMAEPSRHVVAAAVVALSRLAETEVGLTPEVYDALEGLAEQPVQLLHELSEAGDPDTRPAATHLLLMRRDVAGLDALVSLAAEVGLPPELSAALARWGAAAVPALLKVYRRRQGEASAVALELAADVAVQAPDGGAHHDSVGEAIRQAARHEDPAVVLRAARSFGPFAQVADARTLVDLAMSGSDDLASAASAALATLSRREPFAVREAVRAVDLNGPAGPFLTGVLARVGGGDTGERLQAALSADDPRTRRATVRALAAVGGEHAASQIALALADEDVDVQVEAVHALGELRDDRGRAVCADELLVVLEASSTTVRAAAARALGAAADGRAVPRLRELLRQGEPGVAVAALQGLRALRDPTLGDLLVEALGHEDKEVTKEALLALRDAAVDRLPPKLALGLAHPAWDVRRLAATLLGEVGGEEAAEALRGCLEEEGDDLVQLAASAALARLEGRG